MREWFEESHAEGVKPADLVVGRGSKLAPLEHKLYKAILGSLKGGPAVKFFNDMEGSMVAFGNGRQAVLCLYEAVNLSKTRLAMAANTKLAAMALDPVSDLKGLEKTSSVAATAASSSRKSRPSARFQKEHLTSGDLVHKLSSK